MNAFGAVLHRELTLALRTGGAGLAVTFFVLTVALLPLAIGADPETLRALGPGFVWIAAVLAQLLTLERLVQADLEDGTLELLATSTLPLEFGFLAKALAQWIGAGLALTLLTLVAALFLGLDAASSARLFVSILIGLPGLSALGATVSALIAGVRRGSLLLALLVLPLAVPFLIFGSGAASGRGGSLLFLAAVSVLSLAVALILGPRALKSQLE